MLGSVDISPAGYVPRHKEIMLQHGIYDKPNLRMVMEAMLYRLRVGCPWRDLPAEFIKKLPAAGHTIADKDYDSEEVRDTVRMI